MMRRTGQAMSGLAVALDQREAIARQEHVEAVRRLRVVCGIALFVWPGFLVTDVLTAAWVEPGPLWPFALVRLAGWILLGMGYLRLRSGTPLTPGAFRFVDLAEFTGMSVLVAILAILAGGLDASVGMGIALLMLVRVGLLAEPWRRGILPFGLMWLVYPAFLAGGALLLPSLRDQLTDPRALSLFAIHSSLLGSGALLSVLVGHVVYTVRHEAYEAGELGRYRLKRRLGVGGMGEVWIAHHRSLKQDVALKVLKPDLGNTEHAIARFEREVMATTRLTHPNTIRIMDHGVTPEGLWYYAMELLAGQDLGQLIREEGPLEPERAVDLVRQACGSLAEAHRLGFVHRDVKPDNLFVAHLGGIDDYVKVLDFGIAKVTQDMENTRLTREGAVAGTPLYISPEAVRGEPVDARSDVYALGCVLYTALAGEEPFQGDNPLSILMKHAQTPAERPSVKRGADLPPDLEAIVLRCMAKDPADRYEDAAELEAALTGLTRV